MTPFYAVQYVLAAEAIFASATTELVKDLAKLLAQRPPNHPVLDFGCGYGRITLPLAAMGVDIVGVDRSVDLMQLAIRRSTAARDVRFVLGDADSIHGMRASGLLLIDSVLGDERQDERHLLHRLRSCLCPGAPVLVNSLNLHAVVRHLDQSGGGEFRLHHGDLAIRDVVAFDPVEGTLSTSRTLWNGPDEYSSTHEVVLRSPSEYCDLLSSCGFAVEGVYEEGGLRPYRLASPRIIIASRWRGEL